MKFQRFLPHPRLRPFVSFYWMLEPDYRLVTPYRLVPGIGCDIIFQIGPHAEYKFASSPWQKRTPQGFVEGVFREHFLLQFAGPSVLAGIRFTSTGLYPFVKSPLKEFSQQFVDLIDVFGKKGEEAIVRFEELNHAGRRG